MNEVKAHLIVQKRCGKCKRFSRNGPWYCCYESDSHFCAYSTSASIFASVVCSRIFQKQITPVCESLGITTHDERN